MIKIFNDTTSATWRLGKPNASGVTRISGGRKIENVFKGVNMNAPAEGMADVEVFNNTVNSKDIVTVFNGDTSIYYGKFDNMPNIGTNGTNKDIYFIAKDIRGSKIKSITRQDVFVFQYAIVKGTLYLILSVKSGCKEFEIALYDKEKKSDITTTFDLVNDTTKTSVVKNTEEPEMYRLRAFRPSRITTAVLINTADEQFMPESVTNNQNHAVYTYTDDDFGAAANKVIKDGYSAVTVITSLEDVIGNDFGAYDDIITYLRSAFAQVNIVLGGSPTGKIVKR